MKTKKEIITGQLVKLFMDNGFVTSGQISVAIDGLQYNYFGWKGYEANIVYKWLAENTMKTKNHDCNIHGNTSVWCLTNEKMLLEY